MVSTYKKRSGRQRASQRRNSKADGRGNGRYPPSPFQAHGRCV